MAFSFKNALANVVKAVSGFIAPKQATTTYKAPSNSFVNNAIAPQKILSSPVSKPTYTPPSILPNYVLSSVSSANKSNPVNVNTSTQPQRSSSSLGQRIGNSVGSGLVNAGNWIDSNIKSGSGNKIGEVINSIGQFTGQFKDGGTVVGPQGVGVKPKFDFSSALQKIGGSIVKKASAHEGEVLGSNTPTGSFLPGALSSGPSSSLIKPTAKRQEVYAVGSNPDGTLRMSDGSSKANDNSIYGSAKKNYDQFSTDKAPNLDNGGEGAYVALNDQVTGIMNEYQNGNMSEEDARKRMAEVQRKYIESQYAGNKANAEALIPQYETFRDKAIGDINTNLADVKANAIKTKETTSNTYGDILRRATENKRYTDAQRRNQFSALGTADSSAFIENQTRADSSYGSDNNRSEREMADKLSGIDTEVSKAEKSAQDQATAIKTDAQVKIEAVRRSINLSDEEKASKLEEINTQLYSDIVGLSQDLSDKKAALLTTQLGLSGNLQAIKEQGNVDLNTQRAIYDMQNAPAGNSVPADLQQELSGYVGQNSSSYAKRLKSQQLIAAYPAYTDYINQIMNPAG